MTHLTGGPESGGMASGLTQSTGSEAQSLRPLWSPRAGS